MRVQDVMTQGVQTISPASAADDALNVMRGNGIHHLIVTKGARIVGVLSDRDMGGTRGVAVRQNRLVSDLMTTPVLTIEPTATVRRAANVMRGRSIGCLVVADRGRAVGIVTVSDLLELVGRGHDRGAVTSARPLLNYRVPHRKTKPTAAALVGAAQPLGSHRTPANGRETLMPEARLTSRSTPTRRSLSGCALPRAGISSRHGQHSRAGK